MMDRILSGILWTVTILAVAAYVITEPVRAIAVVIGFAVLFFVLKRVAGGAGKR